MLNSQKKNISSSFPPPKLKELTNRSANNFLSLVKTIFKCPSTLVIGAGVSTSAGLPGWSKLLRNIASIYFTHWQFQSKEHPSKNPIPPKDISVTFWESFMWNDDAKKLAEALVKRHDVLTVAQSVFSRVSPNDNQYLLRKALYGDETGIKASPLMHIIADLFSNDLFSAVINYNYDNLLEQTLISKNVKVKSIWEPPVSLSKDAIPIFYPHGYIKQGGGPYVPIVLTEEHYHSYSADSYNWRNLLQLRQFSVSCCVFVGFSMTDPQVRRLLWIARRAGSRDHYAFLPSDAAQKTENSMIEAIVDAQLVDLGVKVIRYPSISTGDRHMHLNLLLEGLIKSSGNLRYFWQE